MTLKSYPCTLAGEQPLSPQARDCLKVLCAKAELSPWLQHRLLHLQSLPHCVTGFGFVLGWSQGHSCCQESPDEAHEGRAGLSVVAREGKCGPAV